MAVKFHNVYDYTIEWHPWQVSENHKPWVPKPCEGNWVVRWVPDETQDWTIVANKLALTFRIRNAPYGVYGKTETHHMVFCVLCFVFCVLCYTRNNKLK